MKGLERKRGHKSRIHTQLPHHSIGTRMSSLSSGASAWTPEHILLAPKYSEQRRKEQEEKEREES